MLLSRQCGCFDTKWYCFKCYSGREIKRIKHDSSFPIHSIKEILKINKLNLSDIDHIVFYEKPFVKFERLMDTYVSFAPRGIKSYLKSMPLWISEKLSKKYDN